MADRANLLLNLAGSGRPDAAELVRSLIAKGTPVNVRDTAGFTAVATAARRGDAGVLAALLEAGAEAEAPTHEHANPPLFWAAAGDHAACLRLLLNRGVSASCRNAQQDTALLWACQQGAAEAAELLLRASTDELHVANNQRMTPLICAASSGRQDVVDLLLAQRPPPALDAADAHGRTALHFAAASSAEIVESLLAAGANWRIRDAAGLAPLGEAQRQGKAAAAAALQRAWERAERGLAEEEVAASPPPSTGTPRKQRGRKGCKGDRGGGKGGEAAPRADAGTRPAATATEAAAAAAEEVEASSSSDASASMASAPEAAPAVAPAGAAWAVASGAAAAAVPAGPPLAQEGWTEVRKKTQAAAQRGQPPRQPRPAAPAAKVWPPARTAQRAAEAAPTSMAERLSAGASRAATEPQPAAWKGAEAAGPTAWAGGAAAEEEAVSAETAAWCAFASRQPKLVSLDVGLHHVLGERLNELSMAQVSTLLETQRELSARLEEVRIGLVRWQEREAVEERIQRELEKRLLLQESGRAAAPSDVPSLG